MQELRNDPRNRRNREWKIATGSYVRIFLGIAAGLGIYLQARSWLELFTFAYILYFVHHMADRIIFKQRVHQIGTEVAIMAFAKRARLWDEGITDQVEEYIGLQSLDLSAEELRILIRGRDW